MFKTSRNWRPLLSRHVAIAVAALSLGLMVFTGAALAAVTFDPATGTGFVGKGDVQEVFGWNNKQLQDNAGSIQFRASSEVIEETTWTCKRDAGEQTQERATTITTTTQGVLSHEERFRNQITGFILDGYDGSETVDVDRDGPAVGSCPTGWSVTEGPNTEEISSSSTLQVSTNGNDWFDLQ
jgi:hypothetical protein